MAVSAGLITRIGCSVIRTPPDHDPVSYGPRQVAVLALKSFMFLSSSSPSPHLQALQIVPGPQAPNAARSVRVSPHQDISLGDVAHHICSTKAAWVHMNLSKFSSTVQAAPFVYRHNTGQPKSFMSARIMAANLITSLAPTVTLFFVLVRMATKKSLNRARVATDRAKAAEKAQAISKLQETL
ncbi:hypothetical protein B0H14DRAFT_2646531 [Mycena olivaceomarginata]|nr:hypothetical protein B0H14DRAFT_2646531 [Mycena olivaceomarginata]